MLYLQICLHLYGIRRRFALVVFIFSHDGFRDHLPPAGSRVKIIEGGTGNLPDENSHRAAMEIYNLLPFLSKDDLVLAFISGMLCPSHNRS